MNKTLGQIAYEAYCLARTLHFDWSSLTIQAKQSWESSAQVVLQSVNSPVPFNQD